MTIAMILELPGVSATQYATARELLGETPPPGNLLHVAGPAEDGWRVIEIWESPEVMRAFFQSATAGAAFQAAGFPPALPMVFPVSTLVSAASLAAQLGNTNQPSSVVHDADITRGTR